MDRFLPFPPVYILNATLSEALSELATSSLSVFISLLTHPTPISVLSQNVKLFLKAADEPAANLIRQPQKSDLM